MSILFPKISFTDLCLNGKPVALMSEGGLNRCELYQLHGRHYWALNITNHVSLDLDVQKSLAEFKYSKLGRESDAAPILDFCIALTSIPPWMSTYSLAQKGCVHWIQATIKVKDSPSNYDNFTRVLRSILSRRQWNILEKVKDEAINLWNERCTPPVIRNVKSINFTPPLFPNFYPVDLERLKSDEKWLSDTHVTLCLLIIYPSDRNRDSFRDCLKRNVWGDRKIILLDTTFWEMLTNDPDKYSDGFMKKNNLIEHDYAVMPMFKLNHWRLGIVEKPAEFIEGNTIFHILDSIRDEFWPANEGSQLQKILLKHFDGTTFMEGRITTNYAQVPLQKNSKDCACFTIYFGKKFFLDPESTMALIKTPFSSAEDGMAAWGLKNSDLTFVRREIRSLLFKYVHEGEAVVEYD